MQDIHSLGLCILSRVHFDKCRRNGPRWGMVWIVIPYGYTFSPGCTLISVGGMDQGGE
jgi:hypothetical protein